MNLSGYPIAIKMNYRKYLILALFGVVVLRYHLKLRVARSNPASIYGGCFKVLIVN
jgi:hypothetical protein